MTSGDRGIFNGDGHGNGRTGGHGRDGPPADPSPHQSPPPRDASFSVDFTHRLRFTSDAFDPRNPTLREVIEAGPDSSGRAIAFVDAGVAAAWPDLPDRLAEYARTHGDIMTLAAATMTVTGGEAAKNSGVVYDAVTKVIDDAGICRHSYVLGVGGGAMLDAVGFAAASAHRGVRLIRLPTTTLAQGDAAIGVKNGINGFGKKNFLGTFSVPWAVINDERFLTTLSDRDWRSGLSEAVKVALLKDPGFFARIVECAPRLRDRDHVAALPIIERTAELHLEHIVSGGDPFELLNARPLDHGHWSAHKLEQLSDFRITHGEAVAIGIAIDALYAESMGMLAADDARAILGCLTGIGFVLYDDLLADHAALLEGLEEFREHLGGRLAITLLVDIGRSVEVHEIDTGRMVQAIERLGTLAARAAREDGDASPGS